MRRDPARPPGDPRLGRARAMATIACLAVVMLLTALAVPAVRAGLSWRLDAWMPPPSEAQRRFERDMAAIHDRGRALVPDGAVLVLADSHLHGIPLAVPGRVVANESVGGITAARTAAGIGRHSAIGRAGALVLLLGHNDLAEGADADAVAAAFGVLLGRASEVPQRVCIGLLPRPLRFGDTPTRIAANRGLQATCERAGAVFVDPFALLADGSGALDPAFDQGDGTHLSEAGYRRLLPAIVAAVVTKPLTGASPTR
jgi:lysophospholipase L1-like esterase